MDGPEGLTSVSPLLTNVALGYLPNQTRYIARQVFANVPVSLTSGIYNILNRGQFLRASAKKLDNREPTPIKQYDWTQANYNVDHWGVAANWSQLDLANAEGRGVPSGRFINQKVLLVTIDPMLALEQQVATLCRTQANWSTIRTGVASGPTGSQFLQWDNANSDPVADVSAIVEAMTLLTGFPPNKMVLPRQVWAKLKNNVSLRSRIQYNASQSASMPVKVTIETLQSLFEIDNILIPDGVINTAREGQADAISYIWGKDVWIGYTTDAPSIENPSAGYFFSWNGTNGTSPSEGVAQGNSEGLYIRRYRTERPALSWVESEWFTTPKVTAADLGALLLSAVS